MPAQADATTENQMRELVKAAGLPPDSVINPPEAVAAKLNVRERLHRFWREKILGFRITYASARGKVCHANQRVIAGAVEMFNVDNGSKMKTVHHADLITPSGELIKGSYLKYPITTPEPDCEYYSYGDMTDNGIIYCTRHGTLAEFRTALINVTGLQPHPSILDNDFDFHITITVIFVLLSAMVLLALFFKKQKPVADDHPE
ncbi:MAG: hypothetical protein CVV41_11795 [Candidatus Riflebacteria bacterium HGW-Riflebacteria-1]|nr:MAG: hypothetical protein CVV41_11795 [Candidatus Riflebacteria bacterium HGW-Riflebacteria-1]